MDHDQHGPFKKLRQVKLGTITPHGADVYSYAPDEDDMVTDPLLARHLEHWGINMMRVRTAAPCAADQLVQWTLHCSRSSSAWLAFRTSAV